MKTARRQRGEGSLYQRKDGLWVAAVDLGMGGDGKRRRKVVTHATQHGAMKKLREVRRAIEDHGDVPTASMTVGAWLGYWVEHVARPVVRPKTLTTYRDDIRLYLAPALGARRIDRLTPAHVREMAKVMAGKGLSSTSALRVYRLLSKALSDAVREGVVTRNVATHVRAPKRAPNTRGAMTAQQAVTLLRSVKDDPYAVTRWGAALFTGARQGELLGLERDRVADAMDLSWQLQRLPWEHGCGASPAVPACGLRRASCPARRLEVQPDYEHRVLTGAYALVRPKSQTGRRIVQLPPVLAAALAHYMATTDPGPHNLVWINGKSPVDARADSRAWHAALAAAKLPPVPLHSARHTTATLLLELGVDGHTVTSMLGHSTITTSRAYQHVSTSMQRQAAASLGDLLALGA